MFDITALTLQTALSGLAQRQRVTANNIANVETPSFTASKVDFEDSLAKAVGSGDPASTEVSVTHTTDGANTAGNNVSLEDEMVTATQTSLQEQLLSNSMTSHFGDMMTILKG